MLCCDDCLIGWAELLLPSDQLVCFDVRVSRLSLIRVRRVSNSTNKQLNTVRHRFGIVPTVKPTTILTKLAQCPYSALAPRQLESSPNSRHPVRVAPVDTEHGIGTQTSLDTHATTRPAVLVPARYRTVA